MRHAFRMVRRRSIQQACKRIMHVQKTEELPNGLGSFVEKIIEMAISAKTADGRDVVKGLTWFNEDMDGGTYNLRLFDADGSINEVGEAYIKGCQAWASHGALSSNSQTIPSPQPLQQDVAW